MAVHFIVVYLVVYCIIIVVAVSYEGVAEAAAAAAEDSLTPIRRVLLFIAFQVAIRGGGGTYLSRARAL